MKQEFQNFFSTAGQIKPGSRANDSWKAKPLACVMGDMDMVRPLGLAGIPCAVVARRGGPQHYSRFTRASLDWTYSRASAEQLVDALVRFGSAQPERPILFYEHDEYVLLLARHRERLQKVFSFV